MKFGLNEKTIQKINSIFAAHPEVEKAVIFGSRAKGNYKNGSDIDLTLHGRELTVKLLRKIEIELDDLLLPYKIDVSIFDQISNPEFVDHILRVELVFYEKKISGDNKSGGKKKLKVGKLKGWAMFAKKSKMALTFHLKKCTLKRSLIVICM